MPAGERREQREAGMSEAMAVQVVDQPAPHRFGLHEAQEGDELRLRHVMRDEAGDHHVPAFAGAIGVIAGPPSDRQPGGGVGARRRLAARVEIDADQLGGDAALGRPARDATQHVAVAEADVEQPQRPGAGERAIEEGERRPCRQRHRVDPREIGDDRGIGRRGQVVRVHQLLALRAGDEAHGTARSASPSAARPGPKASATPSRCADGAASSRASTNISVADDILP
jgi:hypothetical protein